MGIARSIIAAAFGLAAAAPVAAAEPALSIPGGRLRVTQRGTATVLTIIQHGRTTRAVLPGDDGIFARSLGTTQLIGAIPGRVLILASDYESRPNGGAHACGAGTETELRVIALRPAPGQTFHQRIESCWRTVERGEVGWDARARYRVSRAGDVTRIGADDLP